MAKQNFFRSSGTDAIHQGGFIDGEIMSTIAVKGQQSHGDRKPWEIFFVVWQDARAEFYPEFDARCPGHSHGRVMAKVRKGKVDWTTDPKHVREDETGILYSVHDVHCYKFVHTKPDVSLHMFACFPDDYKPSLEEFQAEVRESFEPPPEMKWWEKHEQPAEIKS